MIRRLNSHGRAHIIHTRTLPRWKQLHGGFTETHAVGALVRKHALDHVQRQVEPVRFFRVDVEAHAARMVGRMGDWPAALPEMFTTGFTMEAESAPVMKKIAMRRIASTTVATVAGTALGPHWEAA